MHRNRILKRIVNQRHGRTYTEEMIKLHDKIDSLRVKLSFYRTTTNPRTHRQQTPADEGPQPPNTLEYPPTNLHACFAAIHLCTPNGQQKQPRKIALFNQDFKFAKKIMFCEIFYTYIIILNRSLLDNI